MDIEAIVKKHTLNGFATDGMMRAALTELAAEYEQKIAGLESEAILSRALSERIRQLEAELAESERKLEVSGYAWSLMGEELNTLREQLAESREREGRMREALRRYGRHKSWSCCNGKSCVCGLSDLC